MPGQDKEIIRLCFPGLLPRVGSWISQDTEFVEFIGFVEMARLLRPDKSGLAMTRALVEILRFAQNDNWMLLIPRILGLDGLIYALVIFACLRRSGLCR